jgi:hypothetical protein
LSFYFYKTLKTKIRKAISTINNTETTKYYSGIYEKSITLGQTKELYYIMAYASIVAMYEKTSSAGKMFYIHTDHLGSVNCVTGYMKQGFVRHERSPMLN